MNNCVYKLYKTVCLVCFVNECGDNIDDGYNQVLEIHENLFMYHNHELDRMINVMMPVKPSITYITKSKLKCSNFDWRVFRIE